MAASCGSGIAKMRLGIALLAVATILAFAGELSAQQSEGAAEAEPDAKEVSQYRLSMDKLDRAVAANKKLLELFETDPDLRAAIERSAQANEEESETRKEAEQPAETSPSERDEPASTEEEKEETISEMASRFETVHAQIAPTFQAAGLSTREFIVIMGALFQASIALEFQKQGVELPPGYPAENTAFVEQNEEAVNARADQLKMLWLILDQLQPRK